MLWFRFRRGAMVESLRVAHHVESIDAAGTVRSWCRLTFQRAQIEEIDDPTGTSVAAGTSPCGACVLRWEASREGADGPDSALVHGGASLATVLRKAQWLLDDAAFYLPEGRCTGEECELLAETLEHLAALLRQCGAHRVVIDPSDE